MKRKNDFRYWFAAKQNTFVALTYFNTRLHEQYYSFDNNDW